VTKRRGQGRIDDYANSLPDKEPKESREVIARWYLKIMNRTILTDVLSAALTSLGISYEAEDSIETPVVGSTRPSFHIGYSSRSRNQSLG
jgi:hypothetical protein